jgi:hypothetical protein
VKTVYKNVKITLEDFAKSAKEMVTGTTEPKMGEPE